MRWSERRVPLPHMTLPLPHMALPLLALLAVALLAVSLPAQAQDEGDPAGIAEQEVDEQAGFPVYFDSVRVGTRFFWTSMSSGRRPSSRSRTLG